MLPPPPQPLITTLDDEEKKEDGELSDDEISKETKLTAKRSKNTEKEISNLPAENSNIEIIGDGNFALDDEGVGHDTMNIDDEEVFKKIQEAAGIHSDDMDISLNISESPQATPGHRCFNCMGPHNLRECTEPLDQRKINSNRRSFGSSKKARITDECKKYTPGQLSDEALEALNLATYEYPQWIMKMREMGPFEGYPPGYLKRFKPCEKRLSFHCDDPKLTNEIVKSDVKIDKEKILYYPGFNLIDHKCDAERKCAHNIRRELQWKKWNKETYPAEFEKFLKDSINKDRVATAAGSRKRQHESDDQQNEEKRGRFNDDANAARSTDLGKEGRPNTHIIFDDEEIPDTPASPELAPVISRALTEDQAEPKEFLVPFVDDRKVPDIENFAVNITPFQYENLDQKTGRMDKLEDLLKYLKKD